MKWKFGKRREEPEDGFWGEEEGYARLEYDEDYEDDDWDEDEDDYDEDDDYYDEDEYEEKPRTLRHTVIYMVIVLAVAVLGAIAVWFAADDVMALTKPDNDVTVTISQTDTLSDVADNLKAHGLIRYKGLFMLYGIFSHAESKMGSGTFQLNQQFDYHALVNGLAASSETRETVTLTFPEGYTCEQMFRMLDENGVCSLDELHGIAANYAFDYDFLQDLPYGSITRLEGYMFPDTYDFYLDDDPMRVIGKFLSNFDSRVTDEMLAAIDDRNAAIREAMEAEGSFSQEEIEAQMMDVHKLLTLASLIEKEAGSDTERPLIASVIYNRLTTRIHPLLQIDASVEYALGEHRERLTAEDLDIASPYNTYRYEGLPPGPIANPGLASITAALYPKDTDYFFYALESRGSHRFFETYMEQEEFLTGGEAAEFQNAGVLSPEAQPEANPETPEAETPEAETPEGETPEEETPEEEPPEEETPEEETPEEETPEEETPEEENP